MVARAEEAMLLPRQIESHSNSAKSLIRQQERCLVRPLLFL